MQRYSYFLILQIFTRFFIRKYFSFIFCAFLKMYFRLWNEDNRWHYEWRRRVGKHVPWADKIIYLCLLTDWEFRKRKCVISNPWLWRISMSFFYLLCLELRKRKDTTNCKCVVLFLHPFSSSIVYFKREIFLDLEL